MTPYPRDRKLGCDPGLVWMNAENLAPAGIRSRTAQSVAL